MANGTTVTRTFAAPRKAVWSMWTTPEHFATWFGTEAVTIPLDSVDLDVREGGAWKATMLLPDGSAKDWVGEYTEVAEPSRLVFTMTDEPESPERAPVSVELVDVEAGTRQTVTQTGGGLTAEQYEHVAAGYRSFFDVMERLLAGQA